MAQSFSSCVIFGGAGFIGTHLARHLLSSGQCSTVHIVDTRSSELNATGGVTYSQTDVRRPIPLDLVPEAPDWIFNLAAIHREPGHEAGEYFETNLLGAQNVCSYASSVGCRRIYFTSSISVYGPSARPVSEDAPIRPISPYGASKYMAEWIHRAWLEGESGRRLIVSRPGVIYGPGDPGNVLRMIRAIKRGYFAFPGEGSIRKSYGYVFGLLDSIDFTMARDERLIIYNFVQTPTDTLMELAGHTKEFLGSRAPVFRIPQPVLLPVSTILAAAMGKRSPIHPTRVRKAAMSTHIIPGWLVSAGFRFDFPFTKSLEHWRRAAPKDFQ